MKFEHKYPNAGSTQRFEFEYSYVTKTPKLGTCTLCRSFTKWLDVVFQVHACSEECLSEMWRRYKADKESVGGIDNFGHHFKMVKEELLIADNAREAWKDILIVVHDQLDYLKQCIESVQAHSKNYHLYIWDNGSKPETANYIESLMVSYDPDVHTDWAITTIHSDTNTGFIFPNNELAALGDSEYIILLNSDTKVFDKWDRAITGFMDGHPEVGLVGAWGGHMGADGRGFGGANGYEIDYVPGWCLAMRRSDYDKFGLFNKELQFAYCEDADLSLRMKEAGYKLYALHAPLVHHYQNKTIVEVEKEGQVDVRKSFDHNHAYIKERWKHYLEHERVLLKRRTDSHEPVSIAEPTSQ